MATLFLSTKDAPVSANALTKRLLRGWGINPRGLQANKVEEIVGPRFDRIFKEIQEMFIDLVMRSSLSEGPYKQPSSGGPGEMNTRLANSLEQRRGISRTRNGLQLNLTIISTDRKFPFLDKGKEAGDMIPMSSLLSWANRQYGWGIQEPGRDVSADAFWSSLRSQTVSLSFGGEVRADYAFMRLWKAVRDRAFVGMKLQENLQKFAEITLAKNLSSAAPLDKNELLGLLAP